MTVVLDASALLAYLHGEKGSQFVAELIGKGAYVTAVNWAEVLSKFAERGITPEVITARLTEEGILGEGVMVRPVDEELAIGIASLYVETRKAGLSLGDRACLALGRLLGLPVVTADGAWSELDLGVEVELIR